MNELSAVIPADQLPFFVTAPGDTDLVLIAVAIFLVAVIIGFGSIYLTIQAWPDRLARGAGKVQLQIVGILGLLSLLTFNNVLWIAAILLAAIRIPDLATPLREIAKSLSSNARVSARASAGEEPPDLATNTAIEGTADAHSRPPATHG